MLVMLEVIVVSKRSSLTIQQGDTFSALPVGHLTNRDSLQEDAMVREATSASTDFR